MSVGRVSLENSPTSGPRSMRSASAGSTNRVSHETATSSNMTSTRRESSAAGSWITCSDKSMLVQSSTSPEPLLTRTHSNHHQDTNRSPQKSRLYTMLSAIDRKKKPQMPAKEPADLESMKDRAPSEDLAPNRAPSAAVHSANKLQPRGATERQSVSDLREFLKSTNPTPANNEHQPQLLKSQFDWDSDDDEGAVEDRRSSISQVRNSNLESLHRITRRWQEAMVGSGKAKATKGSHETAFSIDAWMANARKYAERRRSATASSVLGGQDRATSDGSGSTSATTGRAHHSRRSVLQLFDDPVWTNEGKSTSSTLTLRDQADACMSGGASIRTGGYNGVEALISNNRLEKSSTMNESMVQVRKDLASEANVTTSTPTKSEVKVDWFFGTPPLPQSFRYIDWSRHGRGLSIVDQPVMYAPDTPQMPSSQASQGDLDNRVEKSSKISVLKKLRSQLFDPVEVLEITDPRPHRPASAKPLPVSKSSLTLRRGKSAEDLRRKRNYDDPFTDDAVENAMPAKRADGGRRSLDGYARRFNDNVNSPTKETKRAIYPVYPELGIYTINKADAKLSPSTASSRTPKNIETSPIVKGYPSGPEDPNWNDAVRRVRRIVQEREKQEAEEARQQKKELKMQEKKMKKLRAGKDVVLRGSHFGLATKKPLDDITEEEFEAVGGFATTPAKDASISKKRGIFSMLFTKILGNNQEKEELITKTRSKLGKHKSLEVLNFEPVAGVDESLTEGRDQYERALRALNGEDSPFKTSSKDKSSSDSPISKSESTVTSLDQKSRSPCSDHNTQVGLGIMSENQRQSPPKIANKTYHQFINLKRQRLNLGPEDEDITKKRDGIALSDIAEEDIHHRTKPQNGYKDEDASSWCTESIHSIDQVERMIEPRDKSGAPQLSMPDFARGNEHATNQYAGCYASSISEDTGMDDDAASKYSDHIEMDAMPAPLDIRVLRVKSSTIHPQSAHSSAFIPDRKASFHAKIQEVSRLHQAHIGGLSHPALREISNKGEDKQVKESSSEDRGCEDGTDPKPNRDSLDSGIGMMPGDHPTTHEEGYATEVVQQKGFPSEQGQTTPKTPNSTSKRSVSAPKWEGGSSNDDSGESVEDIDLGALRTEVGIGPLRLASSNSSAKHPHHPFTWNHEKVMCRQIHNPVEVLPQLPSFPGNITVNMSRMDSEYFQSSPTKKSTPDAKMCENCGSFCCRFANLLVLSKFNSGGDIMEEMVRTKAQQRVNMLRTYHPNGIEEYETFINCGQCGQQVCPKCAKRCTEQLCQSTICNDCRTESETCPVHASS